MIAPLAKMRFASVLWYQGEANYNNGLTYSCHFPAMIADWRLKFESPELPFYFVVLAPCNSRRETGEKRSDAKHGEVKEFLEQPEDGGNGASDETGDDWCHDFVNMRNAQFSALQLPNTAYALAVDLGDVSSPARSVHTRRKQEVSRRLALAALKMQYQQAVIDTGPVLDAIVVVGSGATATLKISYAAGTAVGLHTAPTADCDKVGTRVCCDESPFEVLIDGQWVRANFTISTDSVSLRVPADAAAEPAVRYAWEQWPQCNLYNGVGAPGTGMHGTGSGDGIAATPFCWNRTAACPVLGASEAEKDEAWEEEKIAIEEAKKAGFCSGLPDLVGGVHRISGCSKDEVWKYVDLNTDELQRKIDAQKAENAPKKASSEEEKAAETASFCAGEKGKDCAEVDNDEVMKLLGIDLVNLFVDKVE